MKLHKLHQSPRAVSARSGFTLLELIIVVSIMAILAGSAIPVSRKLIDRAARTATQTELTVLATGAEQHFEDTGRLPTSVSELTNDVGHAGWTGPYLKSLGNDLTSGQDGSAVDGWSNEYAFEQVGESTLTITSPGPDGVLGELEDYSIRVDVTNIRRRQTLETLEVLNAAVGRYNDVHHSANPLPLRMREIVSLLVTHGFLPETKGYFVDGWGQAFSAYPPNALPVVRIASVRMQR